MANAATRTYIYVVGTSSSGARTFRLELRNYVSQPRVLSKVEDRGVDAGKANQPSHFSGVEINPVSKTYVDSLGLDDET